MKYLVISGASGYIGSSYTRFLLETRELQPILLHRSGTRFPFDTSKCLLVNLDEITLEKLVSSLPGEIEGFVNLAALSFYAIELSSCESALSANINLPSLLLECARLVNAKFFINIGSYWQFYHGKDNSVEPLNLYAVQKEIIKQSMILYQKCFGLNCCNLVMYDTYGPEDPRGKILNRIINSNQLSTPLKMSSGKQKLNFVYIDDCVSAIEKTVNLLSESSEIQFKEFHVRSEINVRIKDILKLLRESFHFSPNVRLNSLKDRPREIYFPYSQGLSVPGWKPKVSFKEGLEVAFPELKEKE